MKEKIKKILKRLDEFIETIVDDPWNYIYYLFMFLLFLTNNTNFLFIYMIIITLRTSVKLDEINKKLNRDSKLWKDMSENFDKENEIDS